MAPGRVGSRLGREEESDEAGLPAAAPAPAPPASRIGIGMAGDDDNGWCSGSIGLDEAAAAEAVATASASPPSTMGAAAMCPGSTAPGGGDSHMLAELAANGARADALPVVLQLLAGSVFCGVVCIAEPGEEAADVRMGEGSPGCSAPGAAARSACRDGDITTSRGSSMVVLLSFLAKAATAKRVVRCFLMCLGAGTLRCEGGGGGGWRGVWCCGLDGFGVGGEMEGLGGDVEMTGRVDIRFSSPRTLWLWILKFPFPFLAPCRAPSRHT